MALTRRRIPDREDSSGVDAGRDLVADLASGDPEVRRSAVLDLADRAARAGDTDSVAVLIEHVAAEADPAVRQATLTALAGLDTVEAASGLVRYLRGEDAARRGAALEAIAAMPSAAVQVVPILLRDPDPDVRILTAMLIAQLDRPESVGWLTDVLTAEEHPNVVSAALDAFLTQAGPEHAALLRGVRDRFPDDPFIRFVVDAAVQRLAER